MARQSKKNVYERIEEKRQEIKDAESALAKLNDELQELFGERDDLQMHQLLAKIRESNIDIDKALELLDPVNQEKE